MSTRAFFVVAALLIAASSCAAQTFSDVPKNHWCADAVEKSARLGLVVGRGDGTFRGESSPTRYELAMGMAKLLAEMENRMKSQPAFTRSVLDELRQLNTYLAKQIEEVRYGQMYLMFLLENHYTQDHRRALPDLRTQFSTETVNRIKKSVPTGGGQ